MAPRADAVAAALTPRLLLFVLLAAGWSAYAWRFGIYFETNDDVAMSMSASGYGAAGYATPLIYVAGALRGVLVALLPDPFGISRYTLFTFLTLFGAAATILFLLPRHTSFPVLALAVTAILLKPLLLPQFTTTAMLCFTAGTVALTCAPSLALRIGLGFIFLLLAAITRIESVYLAPILVAPLLFFADQTLRRRLLAAVPVGLLAVAVNYGADYLAFSGSPEWTYVIRQIWAKTPIVDFRGGYVLMDDPAALAALGITANDVRLILNWWFLDTRLADPQMLLAMWRKVDLVGSYFDWNNLRLAARQVLSPLNVAMLVAFAATILAMRRWRDRLGALAGAVMLMAVFVVFTITGRGLPDRVFHAAMVLLIVLALLRPNGGWLALAAAILLAVAVWLAAEPLHYRSRAALHAHERLTAALQQVPAGDIPLMVGAELDLSSLYPALMPYRTVPFRFFWLASMQWVPQFQAVWPGGSASILRAFTEPEGIPVIVRDVRIDMIRLYCEEHFGGAFWAEQRADLLGVGYYRMGCTKPASPP